MKIGQYIQWHVVSTSNWGNFWQAFASRGFVSDSWAFLCFLAKPHTASTSFAWSCNCEFAAISHCISEMVQASTSVTIEHECEVICDLWNGAISIFQYRWVTAEPGFKGEGGTAAAAPPPFRPGNPALCGSYPLVTPYYCRLGDLLCFVFIVSLLYFFC